VDIFGITLKRGRRKTIPKGEKLENNVTNYATTNKAQNAAH